MSLWGRPEAADEISKWKGMLEERASVLHFPRVRQRRMVRVGVVGKDIPILELRFFFFGVKSRSPAFQRLKLPRKGSPWRLLALTLSACVMFGDCGAFARGV
eukprot:11208341-Lingulodinium_polyedra.AAC.1